MSTKRTKNYSPSSTFTREYRLETNDGFVIESGDIIKIVGQYGLRFRFESVVTNPATGAKWIDCYELERGLVARSRSFPVEDVKRIPKKRPRKVKKNV